MQRHLLDRLIQPDRFDAHRSCLILQHLAGDSAHSWAPAAQHLAREFGITLDTSPHDITGGTTLEAHDRERPA